MSEAWPAIALCAGNDPVSALDGANLAYVIYTSGSTGQPKGTLVSHANVTRLFAATEAYFHFDERDVWTLFHSYAFDFSVWELWGALLHGGRLVVVPHEVSRSSDAFYQLMRSERVTVLNQTPSAFRQLIQVAEAAPERDLPLRLVICGGEALDLQMLQPWFARHGDCCPQLANMYGITETTVHVTFRPISRADLQAAPGSMIGRRLPDLQLYVLDRQLQPAPIGVPGELYVGGAGVARGYLNRPDLTAERFIPNPFAGDKETRRQGDKETGDDEASTQNLKRPEGTRTQNLRLYRTGDLARWLPNGDLEYLGRIDQQVKVRGFRIELGEIEALLAQHPAVEACAVLARKDTPGDVRLVAYVVQGSGVRGQGSEDAALIPDPRSLIPELRTFLQMKLPDYMLPAAFVFVDALPLTSNGKLDRRALPEPDGTRSALDQAFVAPRDPVEDVLATIWARVLGIAQVGIHDNFFALGGHSLLATQVVGRVRDAFGAELPLRRLFEAPTIAELAGVIVSARRAERGLTPPPLRRAPRDSVPLSFAQQRLWFLDQLEPDNPAYNLPAAIRAVGALDVSAMEQSLSAIIRRHEVLRTTFATSADRQVQVIGPAVRVPLPLVDLQGLPEREAIAERLASAEAQRPFDLARGPLLRASLLRLGAAEHVLLLTLHHIVADGWSVGVFMREIAALYPAYATGQPADLPALPIQYADYAVWQRAWLQGSGVWGLGDKETRRQGDKETGGWGTSVAQGAGWDGGWGMGATTPLPPPAGGETEGGRSQESDVGERQTQNSKLKTQNSPLQVQLAYWRQQLADLPVLALPIDRPRPQIATFQGARRGFMLPPALSADLAALSRSEGVTLFMTLLAAWQVLLARYSGQEDIAVGTPIANRTYAETEDLIGCFVNTLVLRADLGGNPPFRELLACAREVCLDAYAHQDLPFEQVVDALRPARDLSHHPLFQVMFAFQNAPQTPLELPGLTLGLLPIAGTTTKFDLALSMAQDASCLTGTLEYRTDLFDGARISRMLAHFETLLGGILADPARPIGALPLLTGAERQQLDAWNATHTIYPQDQCVHQLFEAQVARTPDAIAVVFDRPTPRRGSGQATNDQRPTTTTETRPAPSGNEGRQGDKETRRSDTAQGLSPQSHALSASEGSVLSPEHLSYRELNMRANRLAHHLRGLGVGPEVPVGLCLERAPELVVGLLGVLKAGGAYVPLDPTYPTERLAFMLEDSQAAVLVTRTDDRRPTTDQRPTTNDQRPYGHDISCPDDHRPTTSSEDRRRAATTAQRTGTIYRAPTMISDDRRRSTRDDQRRSTRDYNPKSKIQNPKS